MGKENHLRTLVNLGLLSATTVIAGSAFSWGTRAIIRNRDGRKSVISGEEESLECSHINHDKRRAEYDDESNGRMLTTREHYLDHFRRHGYSNLGLTKRQNEWALRQIWERLSDEEKVGLPPPVPEMPKRR